MDGVSELIEAASRYLSSAGHAVAARHRFQPSGESAGDEAKPGRVRFGDSSQVSHDPAMARNSCSDGSGAGYVGPGMAMAEASPHSHQQEGDSLAGLSLSPGTRPPPLPGGVGDTIVAPRSALVAAGGCRMSAGPRPAQVAHR